MRAEYSQADIDALPEDNPVIFSRPYKQGRSSLDGSVRWVFFRTDESQDGWPTPIATYQTIEEARAYRQSEAGKALYVAPPTPEEIEQEKQAMSDYYKDRLRVLVERKAATILEPWNGSDMGLEKLATEAGKVKQAGYTAGNPFMDDRHTRLGGTLQEVVDDTIAAARNAQNKLAALMNLQDQALALIAADPIDTDALTAVRDEIRAL